MHSRIYDYYKYNKIFFWKKFYLNNFLKHKIAKKIWNIDSQVASQKMDKNPNKSFHIFFHSYSITNIYMSSCY